MELRVMYGAMEIVVAVGTVRGNYFERREMRASFKAKKSRQREMAPPSLTLPRRPGDDFKLIGHRSDLF